MPSLSTSKLSTGYGALGLALSAAYFEISGNPSLQHVVYQAIGLSGVAAVAFGIRRHRPEGPAWGLILAGLALWVAGDGYWNAYRWLAGSEAPFPSPADALYLLAYVPLLAATVVIVRGGRPRSSDVVDATIIGLAAGLLVWFAAIHPASSAQGSTLGSLIAVTYPSMDYLMLLGLVQLLTSRPLENAALRWITAAFATVLLTDILYAWLRSAGTFTAGSVVNAGYFAFYVLLGAGALHPSMTALCAAPTRRSGRLTLARLALLAMALLATPIAIALHATKNSADARMLAVIGSLISVLVLVRLALLFVERDHIDAARRLAQESLERMAYQDALTQLANRTATYRALAAAIERAAPLTATVVLFVDVDGFKQVNDEHGHEIGDRVLREIANRLRTAVRTNDVVGRHGGDEFVILLCNLPLHAARTRAQATADRVTAALRHPIQIDSLTIGLSASIGVAIHPIDGQSPDGLIHHADMQMYAYKKHSCGHGAAA
jgi:diguanylate cyclase